MDNVRSIAALLELRAEGHTPTHELHRALSDLHASVSGGQSVASAIGGPHAGMLGVQNVAQALAASAHVDLAARLGIGPAPDETLASNATTRLLTSVRTTPIAAADPLAPAW